MWTGSKSKFNIRTYFLTLNFVIYPGFVLAILLICLRQDHLFDLYRDLLGLLLLTMAYFYAQHIVDDTISSGNKIDVQALLGLLAIFISRDKEYQVFVISSLPVVGICVCRILTVSVIQYVQCFSNEILYCYLVYHALRSLISAVNNLIEEIKTISLMNILGFLVDSLYVQQQLLLFWLTSFSYNALYYAMLTSETNLFQVDWVTILSLCVRDCCKTYVGLIATSVAVSYASSVVQSLLIFVITDVM